MVSLSFHLKTFLEHTYPLNTLNKYSLDNSLVLFSKAKVLGISCNDIWYILNYYEILSNFVMQFPESELEYYFLFQSGYLYQLLN